MTHSVSAARRNKGTKLKITFKTWLKYQSDNRSYLELRLSVELVIRDSMTLEAGIISHCYNGLTTFIYFSKVKLDKRQRKKRCQKVPL
jgi:hypothetical protein